MCNKAVDNQAYALKFTFDCYKTQRCAVKLSIVILLQYNSLCDKSVNTCPFIIDSVPDLYKSQEMCDKVLSRDPFTLKYCSDKFKNQEIYDIAVNAFLLALKFVPGLFVTKKND